MKPEKTMKLQYKIILITLLAMLSAAPFVPASEEELDKPQRIRVVADVNYPPLMFVDGSGKSRGYLVDWWELWSEKMGVEVDLVPLRWAQAVEEIKTGQADVIDTIFKTPQREAFLSFTDTYLDVPVSIYTHRDISGLESVQDLHGFNLGIMQGDACIDVLENAGINDFKRYRDYRSVIQAAAVDEIKVFCMDNLPAEYFLYQEENHLNYEPAFKLYTGSFRRGVQLGNSKILALIEQGRDAITSEEELDIREKWLSAPKTPLISAKSIKYLLFTGLIVLLFLIISFFWLWSTRKEVSRRTQRLHETEHALRERIKEQKCLHAVYDATEDMNKPLADLVRELATLLPSGWQYPEIAGAQIQLDNHAYPLVMNSIVVAEQRAPVTLGGEIRGWVTVWYTEERDEADEGPFLNEERKLIDQVTARLSEYLSRRFAETALQQSEARFRSFFESTRQAIALIENGVFINANQASLDMLGAETLEYIVGRSPVDISPHLQPDGESSTRKAERMINQALNEGSVRFEWEHHRADGQAVLLDVLLTIIRLQQRDIIHVVWNDITDKKAAEQALFEQQENLEKLVEERTTELSNLADSLMAAKQEQDAVYNASTVGIVLIRERLIKSCNKATEDIFGYNSEEMLGQTTRMWYPDEASFLDTGERIIQAQDNRNYFSELVEFVRKDGSHFWARVNARALDYDDFSKGFAGVITDVSKERAAEENLKQAFLQQEAILNTVTSGTLLIQNREVMLCNEGLSALTGYAASELIGHSTHMLCHEDQDWESISQELGATVSQGETFKRRLKIKRKNGSWFWSRLSARAVDSSDLEQGVVAMLEDITLEQRAFESLESAKQIAEDAAQTKADFLANMSHEIRTPMNAIMGMTHMVLRTELDAKQRIYLEKIQSSSQHLLGVINDILDLSKIEAGKLVLEHTSFNLERLLADVTDFVSQKAAEKDLELIVDLPNTIPAALMGDPLRISQVLLNFANNAVKFTEHGDVAIRVMLEKDHGKSVLLRFEVADTGIGLSEAQREKLFQSFQQADTSTTRKYGGTGLGLAISKRIVDAMGGEIGADSEEGLGSTFWFSLTLDKSGETANMLVPQPDIRGSKVLIVDDNDNAREVIVSMLRSMTFNANSVSSGQQALEELRKAEQQKQPYDVILLDWQMPEMDGIETARHIAELALTKQPVTALFTAYGLDDLADKARTVNITTILSKPLTPSSLFDAIIGLLGGNERPAQTSQVESVEPDDFADISGASILLVEDNEMNQFVACDMLASAGFKVDVAENGQVALDMLQNQHYALVLMDMQMPVMDGLTATRKIREQYSPQDLPIVAMTANAMASDRAQCIDAGMNDYLAKPIDPEKMWQALRRWIKPVHRLDEGLSAMSNHARLQAENVSQSSAHDETKQQEPELSPQAETDKNEDQKEKQTNLPEQAVLLTLLQMLADDEYGSQTYLQEQEALFTNLLGRKKYQQIYKAVSDFDYHKAYQQLQAAMGD